MDRASHGLSMEIFHGLKVRGTLGLGQESWADVSTGAVDERLRQTW